MELTDYDRLERLPDRELFDFLTETDASQRKWVAIHLLEMRRNRALTSAARSSAIAAWVAAALALISALVTVVQHHQVIFQ